MNIPKFYIYGVPDGFDILDVTPSEITYFQRFYNPSKENTKFSIHRDSKGNITYSYLKYNLSSGKSRTGSFFGMSLIFQGKYCGDPMLLYDIFDWVYNTYILTNDAKGTGFIKPLNGNSDIQARYVINSFSEQREYIKHSVEAVLLANIQKEFADCLYDFDSSFTNEKPNLVIQEPMQIASNERILAYLKQYNRVAVSPDWATPNENSGAANSSKQQFANQSEPIIVLAPEYLAALFGYTKEYQNFIIDTLDKIGTPNFITIKAQHLHDATERYQEVSDHLQELLTQQTPDIRIEQLRQDYQKLADQLQNLIDKIEKYTPPIPWWKQPKIIGGISAIVLLLVALIIVIISLPKKHQEPYNRQPIIEQNVRELINQQHYIEAIELADSLDVTPRKHLQDSALALRIDSFIEYTKKYSETYNDIANQISDKSLKSAKQQELLKAWEKYINQRITEVEKSNDSPKNKKDKAEEIKKQIEQKNSISTHSDSRKNYINRLDKIISAQNTATTTTTTTSKPSSTKYRVEIWKVSRKSQIDYDPNNPNKNVIDSDTTISGSNFYYRLMLHNGNGKWSICSWTAAEKQIEVSNKALKTKGTDNGWYKIEETIGTLTINNGNSKFKITITEE